MVEEIARLNGEPAWLLDRRLAAWEAFGQMDLPSQKEEAWRRTNLTGLDLAGFVPYHPETPATDGLERLPAALRRVREGWGLEGAEAPAGLAEAAMLQHNSSVVARRESPRLASRGVIFADLHEAARRYPDLLARHLLVDGAEMTHKLTALHGVLMSGGAFLYVPAGVKVTEPLEAVSFYDAPRFGAFNHTLVVAEAGAEVTLVERFLSPEAAEQALHSGMVEVWAGEGARVTYVGLQRWGSRVFSFSARRAHVAAGARVDWVTGEFGGALTRVDQECRLEGHGAGSDSITVYFGGGRQHMDIGVGMVHQAPGTRSEILARGAVGGQARAVYRGLGHIMRGARQAVTSQRNQSIMLSEASRSDAIPSLLIDEDEVQAGHAVAAGRVDAEQIFYLQSRGIPEAEAQRMIVTGFFQPLVDRVPLGTVRQELLSLIEEKMKP